MNDWRSVITNKPDVNESVVIAFAVIEAGEPPKQSWVYHTATWTGMYWMVGGSRVADPKQPLWWSPIHSPEISVSDDTRDLYNDALSCVVEVRQECEALRELLTDAISFTQRQQDTHAELSPKLQPVIDGLTKLHKRFNTYGN